jgi:hypothetical protein
VVVQVLQLAEIDIGILCCPVVEGVEVRGILLYRRQLGLY